MTPAAAIRAAKIALCAVLAASPLALHAALANGRWKSLAAGLIALQVFMIAGLVLRRLAPAYRWPLAALVSVPVVALAWRQQDKSMIFSACVIHAAIYLTLLAVFARTLSGGREPVATRFARLVHGPLPPDILAYTRHVTQAWCIFFACQLAASPLLLWLAPLRDWSLFVNVLNYPLVAAMFVAEYLCRFIALPNHRHDRPADMARLYGHVRAAVSRQAAG